MIRFGLHIRACREARGQTQAVLADRSGLSVETIQRIERGRFSPSLDTLRRLAGGLELELSTLFEGFELRRCGLPVCRLTICRRFTYRSTIYLPTPKLLPMKSRARHIISIVESVGTNMHRIASCLFSGTQVAATREIEEPRFLNSLLRIAVITSLVCVTSCEYPSLDRQYETEHLHIESALTHPLCGGDLEYYEVLMSRTAADLSIELELGPAIRVFVWSDVDWPAVAHEYCEIGSGLNLGCYREGQVYASGSSLAHELIHVAIETPQLSYFFAEGIADMYSGHQSQFASELPSSYESAEVGGDVSINRNLAIHFIQWLRYEWGGERLGQLVAKKDKAFRAFESVYGIPLEVAEAMYLETAPAAFPALYTCDSPRLEAQAATNSWGERIELDCDESSTRAGDEGLFATRTFFIEEPGDYILYSNHGWMRAARCLDAPIDTVPPPREAVLEDIPYAHSAYPSGAAQFFFGGVFNQVDLEDGIYTLQIGIEGFEPGVVEVGIWPDLGPHPEQVP